MRDRNLKLEITISRERDKDGHTPSVHSKTVSEVAHCSEPSLYIVATSLLVYTFLKCMQPARREANFSAPERVKTGIFNRFVSEKCPPRGENFAIRAPCLAEFHDIMLYHSPWWSPDATPI